MRRSVRLRTALSALVVLAAVAGAGAQEAVPPAEPPITVGEPAAEPTPEPAASAAREALDREAQRVRVLAARVADFEAELGARREAQSAASQQALERIAELSEELRQAEAGSVAADAVYDQLVGELKAERLRLRRALEHWSAPSEAPTWQTELDLALFEVGELAEETRETRRLIAELEAAIAEVRLAERRTRWDGIERITLRVRQLNQLRLESLPLLSDERRQAVLGLSREGIGQLGRELEHLALGARVWRLESRQQLTAVDEAIADVFTLGTITWSALKAATILALAWWLRRRWRELLQAARRSAVSSLTSVRSRRRVEHLARLLDELLPWPLVAAVVLAFRWALGPAAAWPVPRLVVAIALIYCLYRFAIDVFVRSLVGIAHRYELALPPELRTKLIASVRTMMRVAGGLVAVLVLSRMTMGRGALYTLVEEIGWLLVAATLVVVLLGWRRVIADTFCRMQPSGRLATVVRASRDRWYGVLVAPAAFLWLAGRAAAAVARDFALGFEQTGKILAFLFRRRVEKQAELRGYAESGFDVLPPEVVEAFSDSPVGRGPLAVACFPGLDRLQREVSAWRSGGSGGATLVHGERGIGLTTWLAQVRREDVEVTRLELSRRIHDPAELLGTLATGLGLPPGADASAETLVAALEAGEPRLVILDLAQHLFLATVGGYETFGRFAELLNRTRRKVFWLCGMSEFAWRHLRAVRPDAAVFRHHCHLPTWSETQIRQLLRQRMQASGWRFNFADLVLDGMEGVTSSASLVESEEGYTRLLWDYADGNPRVALHFFLRSLEPEGARRLKVRLFRAPDPARLEEGGEAALFVMAALITHESIEMDDLARVTRFPLRECQIQTDRLLDLGAIVAADDGLLRVSTTWHRAMVRLLKRRNTLPD